MQQPIHCEDHLLIKPLNCIFYVSVAIISLTNMNVSRVLSTAAKRAPTTAAVAASKISQRGFAVAATQQAQSHSNNQQTTSDSRLVGGVFAAAAAASALAASNAEKADCCGIAGVVGGSGDAR